MLAHLAELHPDRGRLEQHVDAVAQQPHGARDDQSADQQRGHRVGPGPAGDGDHDGRDDHRHGAERVAHDLEEGGPQVEVGAAATCASTATLTRLPSRATTPKTAMTPDSTSGGVISRRTADHEDEATDRKQHGGLSRGGERPRAVGSPRCGHRSPDAELSTAATRARERPATSVSMCPASASSARLPETNGADDLDHQDHAGDGEHRWSAGGDRRSACALPWSCAWPLTLVLSARVGPVTARCGAWSGRGSPHSHCAGPPHAPTANDGALGRFTTVVAMSDFAARPFGVGIDVADPAAMADFWQGLDGVRTRRGHPDATSTWCIPSGATAGIYLHKVPEARPPGKNRLHLELWVDDLETARATGDRARRPAGRRLLRRLRRRARHVLHGLRGPRGQRVLPRRALSPASGSTGQLARLPGRYRWHRECRRAWPSSRLAFTVRSPSATGPDTSRP